MYTRDYSRRVQAVFLLFIAFLIICLVRLVIIQLFRSAYLSDIAKKQHNLFIELEPQRGAILDTNLKPQAVNIPVDSVYAAANEIPQSQKDKIIRQLSPILGVNYSYLDKRLSKDKSFVWLARKIEPAQSRSIEALRIKGIGLLKESKRCYPNGYLASHVLGFAGLDNLGLEGIEMRYNKYLKGTEGWALFLRDARQQKLGMWERMVMPKDGYDIVLTIDEVIQYIAERHLEKSFESSNARAATIIVMDCNTGAVLALANRPNFDPNLSQALVRDNIRNRAVCDLFEPGSVFKIVTASMALEEGKVNEFTRIFCENGSYRVASHTLHDHTPHGWLSFREVIEQSSNIGTTKVAQMFETNDTIYRYIKSFGFGSKLGIDLPGEISGLVKDPRQWSKVSIGAIPMGQEVGVTALQLVSAISVIANGGMLMRPYVVREVKDKYGETIKSFPPQLVAKVLSRETAARVSSILEGVIEKGTGKMARIEGVRLAGKTGTAQKLEDNGAYSHRKYVASFIGFAPADNPLISIVVVIDEPRPYYFGGVVAAPVFKNVAEEVLRYLNMKNSQYEEVALYETQGTR